MKVGPVNQVNHTSWVAIVTPTDRPKSDRNRSVIDCLWCCLCCHFALLAFLLVWGLFSLAGSDLFLFLLLRLGVLGVPNSCLPVATVPTVCL